MSGISLNNNNRPVISKRVTEDRILNFDDNNAILVVDSAVNITLYISSAIPVGFTTRIIQRGAGQATVAALAGVTIINPFGISNTNIAGDYINIVAGLPAEFFLQTIGSNSGSGGGGGGGGSTIKAISANFTDATNLNSAQLVGNIKGIFLNEINRFLENSEWAQTGTGIQITIPGFDATVNSYTFYISILTPFAGGGGGGGGV